MWVSKYTCNGYKYSKKSWYSIATTQRRDPAAKYMRLQATNTYTDPLARDVILPLRI
jgi:hypothetical protein